MLEPRRPSLFVVDRDPHVCKLMRQFLAEDWAVACFSDGYSALDQVRRTPPSLLITEILVPELDGLALCRLLKGDPVTQGVPILVYSMIASSTRATQAGADAFLEKPVERGQLLAALRGISGTTGHEGARSPGEHAAP